MAKDNIKDAQAQQPPQPNPDTVSGEWVYPGGGGYRSTMSRVK
jgi:hypothetical protein